LGKDADINSKFPVICVGPCFPLSFVLIIDVLDVCMYVCPTHTYLYVYKFFSLLSVVRIINVQDFCMYISHTYVYTYICAPYTYLYVYTSLAVACADR